MICIGVGKGTWYTVKLKQLLNRGAWVAQSVKRLILAQVMISWFVGLSPAWGYVLTARSLEPASDSVSPSLTAPPLLTLFLALSCSLSQVDTHKRRGEKRNTNINNIVRKMILCLIMMSLSRQKQERRCMSQRGGEGFCGKDFWSNIRTKGGRDPWHIWQKNKECEFYHGLLC